MQIQADFSEAIEMSQPLPAGTYKVRVESCESRQSQTSGNTYLNWKLTTFGNDKSEWNNRVVYHSTPIVGKGAGILKAFLTAVTGEATTNFDTEKLYGGELRVTVEPERNKDTGEQTGFVRVKSVAKI